MPPFHLRLHHWGPFLESISGTCSNIHGSATLQNSKSWDGQQIRSPPEVLFSALTPPQCVKHDIRELQRQPASHHVTKHSFVHVLHVKQHQPGSRPLTVAGSDMSGHICFGRCDLCPDPWKPNTLKLQDSLKWLVIITVVLKRFIWSHVDVEVSWLGDITCLVRHSGSHAFLSCLHTEARSCWNEIQTLNYQINAHVALQRGVLASLWYCKSDFALV